jgi:hypothetical protein
MRFIRVVLVTAATLVPLSAHAQERAGDAALGALSGVVVFGPVGLVVGAVVGFTAGPAISRSWRRNRDRPRHVVHATRPAPPAGRPTRVAARSRPPAARVSPAPPAAGTVTPQTPAPGTGGPPAQGLE